MTQPPSAPVRHPISLPTLTLSLIGMIIASVLAALAGFAYTSYRFNTFVEVRKETRNVRVLQQAASDAHIAILATAFTPGEVSSLRPYYDGLNTLGTHSAAVRKIDAYFKGPKRAEQKTKQDIAALTADWAEVVRLIEAGKRDSASEHLVKSDTQARYGVLRDDLERYWRERTAVASVQNDGAFQNLTVALQIAAGFFSIVGILLIFRMTTTESEGRAAAKTAAEASRLKMDQLFQMADMLQSASGHLDANAVLKATAERLLPGLGGALYIFNNSRDRLDRSTTFGPAEETAHAAETISPTQCWALKRGKPHINQLGSASLCCDHHDCQDSTVLEIPMTARGELLGLLQVSAHGEEAQDRLNQTRDLAMAIADGMSLALSNIALREKLRSQALRDPLTGLYNRRYMEDSLERLVRLASREKKNLSLMMIDLDHFKKLNDNHGHAMGDAVLRETAAAILGALRESDVACRYGGEELLVIMPDCSIEDAGTKAENIRERIHALSGHHGTSISASFGVSSMPLITSQMTDLIASADAALYAAKRNGRNCVVMAEAKVASPRQAVSDADEAVPSAELIQLVAAE